MKDEVLEGLVWEYINNPLETERRGIICDRLEDLGDYRLARLKFVMEMDRRASNLNGELDEQILTQREIASAASYPMVDQIRVEVRRLYLCTLFRYCPVHNLVASSYADREEPAIEYDVPPVRLWDWMYNNSSGRSIGNDSEFIRDMNVHKAIVASEMSWCHLFDWSERRLTLTYMERRYSLHLTPPLQIGNAVRWNIALELATVTRLRTYRERALDIDITELDPTQIPWIFNFKLWSRVYYACPLPASRMKRRNDRGYRHVD